MIYAHDNQASPFSGNELWFWKSHPCWEWKDNNCYSNKHFGSKYQVVSKYDINLIVFFIFGRYYKT